MASPRVAGHCLASARAFAGYRSGAAAAASRAFQTIPPLRQAVALLPRGLAAWRADTFPAPQGVRRLSVQVVAASSIVNGGGGGGARRAFAGFKVYKGRGALQVSPIRPSWRQLEEGSMAIDKPGVIFLEFAPAAGERNYDWSRKMTFAMNATEVGTILETPSQKLEFFHDPGKGGSGEGSVSKVLRVEPTPDGNGYFFSITMSDKAAASKSSLSIPVSLGEFGVLKSLFNYSLPHLLGFDEVFNCQPQLMSGERSGFAGSSGFAGAGSFGGSGGASPGYGIEPTPSAPAATGAAGGEFWQQYGQQAGAPYAAGESGGYEPMDDFAVGEGPPYEEGFAGDEQLRVEEEEEPQWQPSPDSANAFGGGANNAFGERPPF